MSVAVIRAIVNIHPTATVALGTRGYEENARGLIAARSGPPYIADRDADVILVVHERPWVFLTRIR